MKANELLHRRFQFRTDKDESNMLSSYTKQRSRLQSVIKGVLIWLMKLPWTTSTTRVSTSPQDLYHALAPVSHHNRQLSIWQLYEGDTKLEVSELPAWNPNWVSACFVTVSMWYILRHCEELAKDLDLWSSMKLPRTSVEKLPRKADAMTAIAQWYHSHCLFKLSDLLKVEQPKEIRDLLNAHVSALERESKMRTRISMSSKSDSYSNEAANADCLVLLYKELDVDSASAIECVEHVRKRIEARETTTTFNPGIANNR